MRAKLYTRLTTMCPNTLTKENKHNDGLLVWAEVPPVPAHDIKYIFKVTLSAILSNRETLVGSFSA